MTKTLTIQHRTDWMYYVCHAAEHDCYHTWNFHSLNSNGTALLFIYEEELDFIAFPFIKRSIEGTEYNDLSSVQGYVGPISNQRLNQLNESFKDNFRKALSQFLVENNIVSVFSRTHPFFDQCHLLEKLGGIHENGFTLAIDLSLPIEQQRQAYRTTTYSAIKKAWKKGYTLRDEKSEEAIKIFLLIYDETMNRVEATNYYRFDDSYIHMLLHTNEYDARLLTVYDGEVPIASTVIIISKGIMQAYLIATRQAYLHLSPAKFIVDAVSELGRTLGLKYYNLGGGLGFKEDGLFDWKSSFTNLRIPFRSWRYISNSNIYHELLEEKGIDKDLDVDFFPLYRFA